MKIFLTGAKGVGKSTCINEIMKECVKSVSGFQTLPFYENGIRTGFYMHALQHLDRNDVRFSIQRDTYNETIVGVFDTFGVQVLQDCLRQPNDVVILDEIGYLEKEEYHYLAMLEKVINECDNIIGVLRKCEIQYIVDIKNRKDILLFDLDQLHYEDVYRQLRKCVEEAI